MNRQLLTGVVAVGVMTVGGLVQAEAVKALSFNGGAVTISASDINQSFVVDFNGNVATQNVAGLSSKAVFTFLGFTSVGNNTEAKFDVALDNTSSGGITSRTSALGFDVNLALLGIGNSNNPGNTRSSGIFTNDRTGSFPNQFGNIGVCFTDGNNCQGGSNGGVSTSDPIGVFSPILAFSGSVNQFTLSNFGVRYQSITGTNLGTSGTGRGTPGSVPIPTPALLPGLIGMGLAAIRKKRAEQEQMQEQEA